MNEYHAINEYTGVASGETSFIPLGIYPDLYFALYALFIVV